MPNAQYEAFKLKYDDLKPGRWFVASSEYELQQFYVHQLNALIAAGREIGYCILPHGSLSRDLDLVAVPWAEDVSDKDELAKVLAEVASPGIVRKSYTLWEVKPHGRRACSIPICMTDYNDTRDGVGHIDLSVMDPYPYPI